MRAAVVVLALTALAVPVDAEHCTIYTADPEVTTPATGVSLIHTLYGGQKAPGIYYIDNDPCQPQCVFSVWIYEETNGVPGLQRDRDCCSDRSGSYCGEPDTIIF